MCPDRNPVRALLAARRLSRASQTALLAGDYRRSAALCRRGLELTDVRCGALARPLRVNLHNQLGVALRLGGDADAAQAAYGAALDGASSASARGAILHNVGGLAFARGELDLAEALTRRAIAINRRRLGPTQLAVALDRGMLGAIVAQNGRLAEGESLLRQALATFERRLGPDHREVALALGNLAEVRRRRGDAQEAQLLVERALSVGSATLGPHHPELAPILNTAALLHRARGQRDASRQALGRAIASLESTVDARHPALVRCRANLAAAEGELPPALG